MRAPRLAVTSLLPSMLLAATLAGTSVATPASDRVDDAPSNGPVVQMTVTPSR